MISAHIARLVDRRAALDPAEEVTLLAALTTDPALARWLARQFRPDLSATLAEFLLRACGSDRMTRFRTAADMKAELEAIRLDL